MLVLFLLEVTKVFLYIFVLVFVSWVIVQKVILSDMNISSYPPNVKSCVKKEIARLEEKALNADTEDEWLACELQAVELQISLVS